MIINSDTELDGVTTENIKVVGGSCLTLRGVSNGRITLEPGAKCILHGVHNGTINVIDASFDIFGILNGTLAHNDTAIIRIDQNAIINENC